MKTWMIIGEILVLLTMLFPDFARDMRKSTILMRRVYSPLGFGLLMTMVVTILVLAWPVLMFAFLQGIFGAAKK